MAESIDNKNLYHCVTSLKKTFAFTLAETLIVMGIIGVVAALTIPNLNSATADKEKVAKVQKLYSNLNDAFGRAQAVYGPNKGAKKVGIDVFRLFVADNNIQYLDFNGWMLAQRASYEAFYRLDVRSGLDAVGWIIQNGNMDYLKTDDSGKCPNGKTILNATNKTCK